YGLSPWLTLPASLASTAVIALIIGFVTLRLSSHYLAVATIAWGLSLYFVFANLDALGRYSGLSGLPPITIFSYEFGPPGTFLYLIWGCVLGAMGLATNLLNSRAGRAIRSLPSADNLAET